MLAMFVSPYGNLQDFKKLNVYFSQKASKHVNFLIVVKTTSEQGGCLLTSRNQSWPTWIKNLTVDLNVRRGLQPIQIPFPNSALSSCTLSVASTCRPRSSAAPYFFLLSLTHFPVMMASRPSAIRSFDVPSSVWRRL